MLGEYSSVKEGLEPVTVLRLLAPLLDLRHCSSETKSWVLTAMTKLSHGPTCLSVAQELAERHGGSLDTVLRQRLHELQHLASHAELRLRLLPHSQGLEPLEVRAPLRDPLESCVVSWLWYLMRCSNPVLSRCSSFLISYVCILFILINPKIHIENLIN